MSEGMWVYWWRAQAHMAIAMRDHGVTDADQRVVLLEGGFTGGVATPSVTLNDSPTGLGQWAGDFTLPPLEGELSALSGY